MLIYIVRHAEASAVGVEGAERDFDRMLTAAGRDDAYRMGKLMARLGIDPGKVLASPLVRAQETAALLLSGVGSTLRAVTLEALAPPGDERQLMRALDAADGEAITFVGHEPFLGEVLQLFVNGVDDPPIELAKCSIVCLERKGQGKAAKLRWLLNRDLTERVLSLA